MVFSKKFSDTEIETHLTRIELHRPLNKISGPDKQSEAEQVRTWFKKEFLNALLD